MDGWRRPNHMRSLLDGLQTPTPVNFRRLPRGFHSVAKQASFSVAFGSDFKGFWRPTWTQKSMFGPRFFDVIFECVFVSILARFFEAPNLKNRALASTGAWFLQNRCFQKKFEKCRFLLHFSMPKRRKFDHKSSPETYVFSTSIFMRFLVDFVFILESKSRKKIAHFQTIVIRRQPLKHYSFRAAF